MTEPPTQGARRQAVAGRSLAAVVLVAAIAACSTPTSSPRPSLASLPESASVIPSRTSEPTATPEAPLSLDVPAAQDPRLIRVAIAPNVPPDGNGRIVVTVTNLSDERVTELVLRWPTELQATLFLAPFEPSQARVANGGPPLVQDWTKWVEGPGERGEPAGTTSLGWGPLDPGAELTIPILVTRRAPGAVEFDLQLLAGEAILLLESGEPAELRVSVP
jgi:hypothetical protein